MKEIPRPEYPRPQFTREEWLCLNGQWQFEIDAGDSGLERKMIDRPLSAEITVPFCPESELSGIGHVDFMNAVWYRKEVKIPQQWAGKKVLLHFQAVDYDATVWVNGVEVRRHRGGFTPLTCDLSGIAEAGETVTIVVRARDINGIPQPRGKQSNRYENYGCVYTRTTGIWQTVWMEPVSEIYLKRPRVTPNVANSCFQLNLPLNGNRKGYKIKAVLRDADMNEVDSAVCRADLDLAPQLNLNVPEDKVRLWSIEDPYLYDIEIILLDENGEEVDKAKTYGGLRSVSIEGKTIKINGETVFQRLVLDQGYYPDGLMTAPSEEALVKDIELSQQAGFNGARLHQKVFEERFLYHCDRLGYIVWGEFADWGCQGFGPGEDHAKTETTFVAQWLEVLERDYSHPSIVGWCPLNETRQKTQDRTTILDDATRGMFLACKLVDPTRPALDTSGYAHREPDSDVYDSHDYEQTPAKFADTHAGLAEDKPFVNLFSQGQHMSIPYRGQPYFVSEFGGIWWNPNAKPGEASWGYGERPQTIEEFYERFKGLCDVLLDDKNMFGYCYTQLTDVFQEQNGIYTFDRKLKFDMEKIRSIQQKKAAIEE